MHHQHSGRREGKRTYSASRLIKKGTKRRQGKIHEDTFISALTGFRATTATRFCHKLLGESKLSVPVGARPDVTTGGLDLAMTAEKVGTI